MTIFELIDKTFLIEKTGSCEHCSDLLVIIVDDDILQLCFIRNYTISLIKSLRAWRNWQTRTVQVRVPVMGVEVRILSPVLKAKLGLLPSLAFFVQLSPNLDKPEPNKM